MSDDETKQALKEALREWLDDKFATFGKYSAAAIASAALAAVVYFILSMSGYHK